MYTQQGCKYPEFPCSDCSLFEDTSITMAEMQDRCLSEDNGSESVFDFYCEFCREEGKMLEAEGYCVNCGEYLCSTCYTHHQRSRANRHHKLMDKEEMPKDTPLSYDKVNKYISKKCEHHPGKVVKHYCGSHGILGCSRCVVKDHRNCKNVENILEKADSVMESKEYKEFIQMLKQFDQRFRSKIKLVQRNLTKSQRRCSQVAKSLQSFREEINTILDELEKHMLTKAEEIQKEEEIKLTKVSNKITTSLEQVEKLAGKFDHLQSDRKACEIYIKLKESKREVHIIQAKLDETEKENVTNEYAFDPKSKFMDFLSNQGGLGKLPLHALVPNVAKTMSLDNSVNTKAAHVSDIELKSKKSLSDYWITGSAIVSSNRLIVVDEIQKRVKLIDTQNDKVISGITVSSYPWDVTMISRNQAALTLHNSNTILLLNVSDKLTIDREITVGGKCEGVAYSKYGLVVTYVDTPRLEILDLNGNVVKTVQFDSDGNELFVYPKYVCVSKDESTIYVSDSKSHKITSLTFEGEVKSIYSDRELKNPRKVFVDSHDNVYICGGGSNNIHMLTDGLDKIKVILTKSDGLDSHMFSASLCQETDRLFIGTKNNVKVFQLYQYMKLLSD